MRILLVDGHPKVRWALRTFIQEETGLTIVGEASDVETFLSQAKNLQPDLILLEWELSEKLADKLLPALFAFAPRVRVIILSSRPETRKAALDAGAAGFASKANGPTTLLAILRRLIFLEDQSNQTNSADIVS